jgi:two-component system phosphate regulon sensor histidine kinase PhoR
MAAAIFLFARSYRQTMMLNYADEHAQILQSVLLEVSVDSATAGETWLAEVGAEWPTGVVLMDATGHVFISRNAAITSAEGIQLVSHARRGNTKFASGDTDTELIGAIRPIPSFHAADSAYLVVLGNAQQLRQELLSLLLWLSAMVGFILIAVLVISYRVVRSIQTPLHHLQSTAAHFAEGNLQSRSVLVEPIEFHRLGESLNSMAAQLSARIGAIRNQRQQLEAILAAMVEGVLLIDSHHRITSMNPAARRLFQVASLTNSRGELRALLEVIRNSELFDLVRSTFDGGGQQERRIVVYSNPVKHMQVHGTSLEIGGEPHVLVVLNDITRLHELEQIRKEFVANVSHELKTPITSILGFVETLSDGAMEDTEESHRFLDIIATQTHRLSAIIEDLLQLSRLEQSHQSIATEEVHLQELSRRIRENVTLRARDKSMTIREHFGDVTVAWMAGSLVEQAITNLVDNAITYCPEESTIDITFASSGGNLSITVADDGPGIPAIDQPRLFERFYRVDRARSRSLGGTGLGLAIVKHIAQAHGGSVTVESAPGRGSAFCIFIPQSTRRDPSSEPQES